jgi:hypothetical protein
MTISEESFVRRMREIYDRERDRSIHGSTIEHKVDVREVVRSATHWAQQEILHDTQIYEVLELAMTRIGSTSDRSASPKFKEGGDVQLGLADILRVADNLIIGVVYATEDDWIAYLNIKRDNYYRQRKNWEATEAGVIARINSLRVYGKRRNIIRPTTLEAEPYLFDDTAEATG